MFIHLSQSVCLHLSIYPLSIYVHSSIYFFSVVILTVMRDGGAFGTTTVPYTLESAGSDDLSAIPGVLVFADEEIEKVCVVPYFSTTFASPSPSLHSSFIYSPLFFSIDNHSNCSI